LALQSEGFDVHGWSRTPKELEGVETCAGRDGLVRMVGRCNIMINVLPLTDDTRHILSRPLFRHFRDGMCLVNIGRGEHLVEADLLDAIDTGKIEAATLDVTSVEPLPSTHPFWNHASILLTPHVAGSCIPMSAVKPIAANIRKALVGVPLSQQVDFGRGY
jgi:glyoxylate/hydroxypyruvate reductase A